MTDDGINQIAGLTNLKKLVICGSVTKACVQKLNRSLPRLEVVLVSVARNDPIQVGNVIEFQPQRVVRARFAPR